MAGLTSMSRLFQRKQLINILKLISKPSSYAASRAVAPKVLACGGRQVQWRSAEIRRHDSSCVKRTDLNYEDILALLGTGNLQLIDVRETKELDEQGKFPTALNIPLSCLKATLLLTDENFRLMFNIPKPSPHDDDIVFVGFGPVKSNTALEIAHKLGFKNARQYAGGFQEWTEKTSGTEV